MKKINLLLVIVFTLFLCSCGKIDNGQFYTEILDEDNTSNPNGDWDEMDDVGYTGIIMIIKTEKDEITTEKKEIEITIVNHTSSEIYTGIPFRLQQLIQDKWEDIEINLSYEDILYEIETNGERSFVCDLEGVKEYSAGKYRIVKTVDTENETYELTAEYEVK